MNALVNSLNLQVGAFIQSWTPSQPRPEELETLETDTS